MTEYEKGFHLVEDEIMEMLHYLHNHPELSGQEHHTTAYIKDIMLSQGYRIKTLSDFTGLIAEIGDSGPTVALRADMDALLQNINGQPRVMHSCGHDAHMVMLLGAAKLFNQAHFTCPGRLKFIFQPAEETGEGALKMLAAGFLDDVDYLYGVHLRPIQELPSGCAAPAILHGAAQFLRGRIFGCSAHGARPHLGVNVIEIGASLVQELSKLHTDPQVPATVKVTHFSAGGGNINIIPDYGEFAIDIRAQSNQEMAKIADKLTKIVNGLAQIYDARIELKAETNLPAAIINREAVGLMEKAIVKVLGPNHCGPAIVTSGAEDFHFYTVHKPQLKATMLGLGCDLRPGLHHPDMVFNPADILSGVKILATAVDETFKICQGKD